LEGPSRLKSTYSTRLAGLGKLSQRMHANNIQTVGAAAAEAEMHKQEDQQQEE